MIRSLLLSGAASHSNFLQLLRTLNVAFGMCLNDVSRQVVRETCVTMAYVGERERGGRERETERDRERQRQRQRQRQRGRVGRERERERERVERQSGERE